MAKILKRILDVIFILIIIFLAGYLILRATNRVEIFNVETGSMENNIHAGDYILILRKDNYEIGDVITFRKENYYVTHRIIKKDNNTFITKGDANNTEDDAINKSNIVGKVILVGGIINMIINYKYISVVLFLSMYLFSLYFAKEKKEKEIEEKPE